MSIAGQVVLKSAVVETVAVELAANVALNPEVNFVVNFTDGTGASQLKKVGSKVLTIGGSPSNLALTSSADFKSATGAAITFTSVKTITFETPAANVGNVTIGAAASNAWGTLLNSTGTLTLRPGEAISFASKHATGAGVTASDVIKVAGTSGDKLNVIVGGNGS
jgi:hypothetical protein